jgi:hypothetical protein
MDPLAVGSLVFVCTFGGALLGLGASALLPERHLSEASKETVQVGVGLIATMTALVLGLVTASAKSSFDALDAAVKHTAADALALDRTLARYGPEAQAAREALAISLAHRLETIWPEPGRNAELAAPDVMRRAEQVAEQIQGLVPRTEAQRRLRARALDHTEALLEARWVVASSFGSSVPQPFLAVLVFWLTLIFASFGLFAPRNATVVAAFLLCAVSVGGALFLIVEMDAPFDGLIRIPPDPLRFAVSRIGH